METGFDFFTGVPDSTLGPWLDHLDRADGPFEHVLAANEGEATAIAAGHHLATGRIGTVYFQNDGLGNCVNPLTSLAHQEVYGIPMLLIIGWRGEPGAADAPQHRVMGRLLLDLLDLLEVPHRRLPADESGAREALEVARRTMRTESRPYALLVSRGTFEASAADRDRDVAVDEPGVGDGAPDGTRRRHPSGGGIGHGREAALDRVLDALGGDEAVVATTGKLARELYERRERTGTGHDRDFLNVGAMGSAAPIGLGVALGLGDDGRSVVVLDGDGSLLMHLGAAATVGHRAPGNLHHVVFDNGAHDSTGGQPTAAGTVRLDDVADACGYRRTAVVSDQEEVADAIGAALATRGPTMTVLRVDRGARTDLGRPAVPLRELKDRFMRRLDAVE